MAAKKPSRELEIDALEMLVADHEKEINRLNAKLIESHTEVTRLSQELAEVRFNPLNGEDVLRKVLRFQGINKAREFASKMIFKVPSNSPECIAWTERAALLDFQYEREQEIKKEDGLDVSETERILVDAGRYIDALKEIRARLNCPLKHAKDLADAYRDRPKT